MTTASGNEESVSTAVYLAILKGLERLLLTDVLSQQDSEVIMKLGVDRYYSDINLSPVHTTKVNPYLLRLMWIKSLCVHTRFDLIQIKLIRIKLIQIKLIRIKW